MNRLAAAPKTGRWRMNGGGEMAPTDPVEEATCIARMETVAVMLEGMDKKLDTVISAQTTQGAKLDSLNTRLATIEGTLAERKTGEGAAITQDQVRALGAIGVALRAAAPWLWKVIVAAGIAYGLLRPIPIPVPTPTPQTVQQAPAGP